MIVYDSPDSMRYSSTWRFQSWFMSLLNLLFRTELSQQSQYRGIGDWSVVRLMNDTYDLDENTWITGVE